MKYLDSNIILYAIEHPPQYGNACTRILLDIERGVLKAAASTFMLYEVLGILQRINKIRSRKHAELLDLEENLHTIRALPIIWFDMTILTMEQLVIETALLHTSDLVHVVTAKMHDIHEIISADKDFDHVPGLTRIDPLDY